MANPLFISCISEVPEELRDIVRKLYSYDFALKKNRDGSWTLTFPEGDKSGLKQVHFLESDLATGLLKVLRNEELQQSVLYRYEQFNPGWGKTVYGNSPTDSTIAQAGCGPTSLSIVLQYLMNNGSLQHNASYAITPLETAHYAALHGRVSGKGTAGDPMIRGIHQQWPDFDGSRVTLTEATFLLQEGKLIIFLSHGCRGYTRNQPLHRLPDVSYAGHYMVLSGVERIQGHDQLFYVVDPGRRDSRAMCFIKRNELSAHAACFWWVYRKGEPQTRVCYR